MARRDDVACRPFLGDQGKARCGDRCDGATAGDPLPAPVRQPEGPKGGSHAFVRRIEGVDVVIRAIVPGDADDLQRFVQTLSHTARRNRFWSGLAALSPARLKSFTESDDRTHVGLVAVIHEDGARAIIAEAQSATDPGGRGDCALVVSDAWQRRGLGRLLMEQLFEAARGRDTAMLVCVTQSDNEAMRGLALAAGYARAPNGGDHGVTRFERAVRPLLPRRRSQAESMCRLPDPVTLSRETP